MFLRVSAFSALLLAAPLCAAHAESWPAGPGSAPAAGTEQARPALNGHLNLTGFDGGVERRSAVYVDAGTRVFVVRGDRFHARRRAAGFAAAAHQTGLRR